jgi:hypothetical protein
MKRVVYTFLISVLLCAVLSLSFAPIAAAEEPTRSLAYRCFETYATQFADRTVGTDAERSAALWLATRLYSMGYATVDNASPDNVEAYCRSFTVTYADGEYLSYEEKKLTSYDVVGYKRCGVEGAPLLVLAAPYSNEKSLSYGGKTLGYEDAAYSATSVGVLLSVAERLCASEGLTYDVAIAFMGAEYFSFAGTDEFIKYNEQSLIGAIYLSQVGVGDHLNAYYDEVDTPHGDYIDAVIARFGYDVHGKPFDPGYSASVYGGDLPYSHVGTMGGNCYFMAEGVPSVHLFGYNWVGGADNAESAANGRLISTENDTLAEYLNRYSADVADARLTLASDLIVTLVNGNKDFAAALTASADKVTYHALLTDAAIWGFRIAIVVAALAVAAILFFVFKRKTDAAGTPDYSVNSSTFDAQDAPHADNIFGEYDVVHGDNADVDQGTSSSDGDDNNGGNPPDTNDIFGEF